MSDQRRNKGTILIIDDETDVLWFISKMCQPLGYETLTASSGMEGLKYVQECGEKIDLVLLDLRMPGMGGIEVLKSIRKHQPDIPVIVLTAVHDKQEECEALGIEAYVKKPYSLEDLCQRIEIVIDRQTFERADVELAPGTTPCAKILIVDDEVEVCELLADALGEDAQGVDFEVKWVTSGDEALRISNEFEPDIGIVDIKMPHMWGDELIKRFKAGEGYCPKDFIVYTSITDPGEVDRAKRLGHKFLSKPTDLDVLLADLTKICVKHHLLKKKSS